MKAVIRLEESGCRLVVRDIEETMRTYVNDYGIGPWDVYEFNPDTVRDMHEDGEPVGALLASRARPGRPGAVGAHRAARRGQHLREVPRREGRGVHHVGVAVPSFDATIDELGERGRRVVFGGEYKGINFAYLGTDGDLGLITEIFARHPASSRPTPCSAMIRVGA